MAATATLGAAALSACTDATVRVEGPVSGGLVFARVVGGGLDLARLRVADGAVDALSASSPDADETWPYWSPVARALVFQRTAPRPRSTSDLWLWRPSRREVDLTASPHRDERWPAWSPTEPGLVYAFRGGTPAAGLAWILPPDGSPQLLAPTDAEAVFLRPAFAPDGRSLVVQRRGPQGRGSQLWILAPGEPPRPLTHDPARLALKGRFTRDGSRVVFTEQPAAGGPHDVATMAPDGADRRTVASLPESDDHSANPSPARDEIAFVSDRGGSYAVWLAPLAGGEPRALAPSPDLDQYAPRWSPDGERLVVTAVPHGTPLRLDDRGALARARLRVIDREGRVWTETPGLMPDWMPAW